MCVFCCANSSSLGGPFRAFLWFFGGCFFLVFFGIFLVIFWYFTKTFKFGAVQWFASHKAKVESVTTDSPKAKPDPVVKADPPKAEVQWKPLLSLASLKGRLGFGPPSKPERPPAPTQVEVETLEDDENADIQAALHESLKAPSSPQPESGAQSSNAKTSN